MPDRIDDVDGDNDPSLASTDHRALKYQAEYAESERAYDAAMGAFAGATLDRADVSKDAADKAMAVVGSRYSKPLVKSENAANRALTALGKSLSVGLTQNEIDRDNALRSAGANPPVVLSTIADQFTKGTLYTDLDKDYLQPMVAKAYSSADAIPDSADAVPPLPLVPPPFYIPPIPGEIPPTVSPGVPPPPVSPPVAPGRPLPTLPALPPPAPAAPPAPVPGQPYTILNVVSTKGGYGNVSPDPCKWPQYPLSVTIDGTTAMVGAGPCPTVFPVQFGTHVNVTVTTPELKGHWTIGGDGVQHDGYWTTTFDVEQHGGYFVLDYSDSLLSPPPPPPPAASPPASPPPPPPPPDDGPPPITFVPIGGDPPPGTVPPPQCPPCSPPVTNTPTPTGPDVARFGSWDAEGACKLAAGFVAIMQNLGTAGTDPTAYKGMSEIGGLAAATVKGSIFGPAVQGFVQMVLDVYKASGDVAQAAGIDGEPGAVPAGGVLGVATWLERITGIPFGYLATNWRYLMQYASPQMLPGQADINLQYLTHQIKRPEWECLTRANGNLPHHAHDSVLAARSRPDLQQVVVQYFRNFITKDQFYASMRERGVLTKEEADQFVALFMQLPTLADIVTMVKKDVADPDVVAAGNLDQDYEKAFSGQLKTWAVQQGIPEDIIRFAYRASWEFPSNTQLYSAYHRLRPDKVTTISAPDANGVVTTRVVKPVTIADVDSVFKANDVAPAWQDRYLALSYLPINFTAIKQANKAGTMGRVEVLSRIQDLGYSPDDANALTEYTIRDNARQIQAGSGGWSLLRITREYQGGTLSRQEADNLLQRTVIDADTRRTILDDADLLRRSETRRKCIAGTRRQYIHGTISEAQAAKNLDDLAINPLAISQIMDGWRCERASRDREPSVLLVTKQYRVGVINISEFYNRLINLGYTDTDANRIIAEVQAAAAQADAKAREAAADKSRKEAAAEARRIENKAIAAAKAAKKDAEKRAAEAKKEADAAAKAAAKKPKV